LDTLLFASAKNTDKSDDDALGFVRGRQQRMLSQYMVLSLLMMTCNSRRSYRNQ
jgi:hypothetical protein